MADFHIKKGDRLPVLEAVLKYDDGTVINLTDATAVKFLFTKRDGTAVSGDADIVSAVAGSVKYEWGATDTDTVGRMNGEWEVTFPGPLKLTVPNNKHLNIYVHEDLG